MNEKIAAVIFLVLVYGITISFFNIQKPELTGLAVLSSPIVKITDSGFEPSNVTIQAGDTVTWQNEGSYVAVLWSNNADARFTSPTLNLHKKFSFTYEQEGIFKYVDVNFGFKKGAVTVLENQEETIAEEGEKCTVCAEGCVNAEENCLKCVCCRSDNDCDDGNPCTADGCKLDYAECSHTRSPGCILGDRCYSSGSEIFFNKTTWTCVNNEWLAPESEEGKGNIMLSFLAILLLLLIVLVFVFFKTKPRHGKKKR